MNLGAFETCVYCPNLCRHVCPVAVGSGREAATPTGMMSVTWLGASGLLGTDEPQGRALAAEAAALCVDCGACTAECMIDRPVGALLAGAREALRPIPEVEEPGEVEGPGALVAIESDGRRWAEALAGRLGKDVARLRTTDFLGEALLDHPAAFAAHAAALRAALGERTAVVADHASLRVASAAGVAVRHLVELIDWQPEGPVHHPCAGPRLSGRSSPEALACCGARAPLIDVHPAVAAEVARDGARRLGEAPVACPDVRCAAALRSGGADVVDSVDALVTRGAPR